MKKMERELSVLRQQVIEMGNLTEHMVVQTIDALSQDADKDLMRVATVTSDVLVHPTERLGDIADQIFHFHFRQKSIIRRDEDKAPSGQYPGLQCDITLVANLPSATMDPEHDGQALLGRLFRPVYVQHVPLVALLHVGNVRRKRLSGTVVTKRKEREK